MQKEKKNNRNISTRKWAKDHIAIDPETNHRVVYNVQVIIHTMSSERMKVKNILHQDQLTVCNSKFYGKTFEWYLCTWWNVVKSADRGDPCVDDRALIETGVDV